MKKTFMLFCAALLIGGMAFFSSCKKDSAATTNPSALNGSWELTSDHDKYVDSTSLPLHVQDSTTTYTHGKSIVITFKSSDSTFTEVDNTQTPPETNTGTYIAVSGTIVASGLGSASYSISGNILTVTNISSSPGLYSDDDVELYTKQ